MSCCFEVERIVLPKHFLFDSLLLQAQFQSASASLAQLRFDVLQSQAERVVGLNVQLKVPHVRSKFKLVLMVKIINMRLRPTEVQVDLAGRSQLEYVFRTEMGRVAVFANVVEHFSLPRELSVTGSEQSMLEESFVSLNKPTLCQNRSFKKQASKEIRTNDQQEKPPTQGNDAEVIHFQA